MTRSPSSAHGISRQLQTIKIEDDEEEAMLPIDLTDLDDEQEGPEALRDITPSEAHNAGGRPFGCVDIASTKLHGETLKPGDSLQFDDKSFLHNIRIFEELATGLIVLDGYRLVRMADLEGMLTTSKANELCLMLRAPAAGKDANLEDCRATRHLSAAIRKRVIIFTNKSFPAYSVYEEPYYWTSNMRVIKKTAQLVCRWRYTEETINSGSNVTAGSLMMLSEAECDKSTRASEICLFNSFRREETKAVQMPHPQIRERAYQAEWEPVEFSTDLSPKTSKKRPHDAMSASGPVDLTGNYDKDEEVQFIKRKTTETIELISSTSVNVSRKDTSTTTTQQTRTISTMFATNKVTPDRSSGGQFTPVPQRRRQEGRREPNSGDTGDALKSTYTYGDTCTGGGGAASGARQAGLFPNFLLDHWRPACETLRLNFKNMYTNVLFKDIFQFCTNEERAYYEKVDVLHISYPCQTHSPAYTIVGKNHNQNSSALYSVGPLLERCKPRIVTFEQTSGIVTHRGGGHFRALVRQITDAGYNVRWKICNLVDYGNVQPRKRLIIIAACPGETLPTFPEPTHGLGFGKLRPVTIDDVLQRIRNFEVPPNLNRSTKKTELPYNAKQTLSNCITTGGGKSDLHPSGKRSFTLFELAALQGFLPKHRFYGNKTQIRTQIGNAVPSMFAKQLFEHIIKSLQESDRKRSLWKPEPPMVIED
ncbi:hypothetical protein Q7P36_001937 [Cladosporium allicinum]